MYTLDKLSCLVADHNFPSPDLVVKIVIIIVKIANVVIVVFAIPMASCGFYYGNMDTWISFD